MRTSGLPAVMGDVAKSLVEDDWCRMESADGKRSYYIIGVRDYDAQVDAEMSGQADFATRTITTRTNVGPLGEHFVRSQVASSQPEYFERARKHLEQAGVSPSRIDRLVAGDMGVGALFPKSVPLEERLKLLLNFLEAFRVSLGATELDQEEALEVDVVRQKLCLIEVATRYRKIVHKWEQLDRLPFSDSQLEEASKAYLYGFYRAAVVLSASALEKHLKLIAGQDRDLTYRDLVEKAADCRGLDDAWIECGRRVFCVRNKVVHEDYAPNPDEVEVVLDNARYALTQILSGE